MLGRRLDTYRPSLRRWAGVFAVAWLVGAAFLAPISIKLLDQIYDDARLTYESEIPSLLDSNRNAIKLERLSSFLQAIGATRDPKVERYVFLQLQTLAQGFDLDNNDRLDQGATQAVASARRIVVLHGTIRRLTAALSTLGDADGPSGILQAEKQALQIEQDAVQTLNILTDYLTTDAALKADKMAQRIQQNAARVKQGCLAVLAFFVALGFLLLWAFQRHVLGPIAIAVRGLEAVSSSDGTPVELERARFFELDMIGRSVEQYARFADDLRMANLALRTMSNQDGLTGLANRRSFDRDLGEACSRSAADAGCFALLLIDIDRFKLLNDRFGHLVGDHCLRQVAMTLQSFSSRRGDHAWRYGGEEFAVILSDVSPADAYGLAEQLRASVQRAQIYVSGARRPVAVTVSVGVACVASGSQHRPDDVIEMADRALYQAKHNGRNQVCTSDPLSEDPAGSQHAA